MSVARYPNSPSTTGLFARFASYALLETDWRDLKVACAALMLVQGKSGQPVREDDGTVAFHDDDYRAIGEAMLLHYQKKSARMILYAAYEDARPAKAVAERIGVPAVMLPFTVGGTPAATDLFGLFDDTIARLLAAAGHG